MLGVSHLPIAGVIALFLLAATVVWIAGTRLAIVGDQLADRFQLTREFIGLIFLALVTELPEIVTTITSAQVENAALVLGNMFGGITMQTAILAVADFFVVHQALSSWPRKPSHAVVALVLVMLLSSLLAITLAGEIALPLEIGVGAVCLSFAYPLAILFLRRAGENVGWVPVDLPSEIEAPPIIPDADHSAPPRSDRQLLAAALIYSGCIMVAGVALALSADALAEKSSLGSSFIGVTLLAAATSMPELSTTLAAARIGAYTMAISNIFGSNLIMLALLLPADIAYRNGPILAEADAGAQFSIATGILVTAIYVTGMLVRRVPSYRGAGFDSWVVMAVYLGSLGVLYGLQ